MSLLDAALDYAERGLAVFPLVPGQKVPATKFGVHDATTEAGRIRMWWGLNPNYGIGLACGPSDLLVVDIDVRAGFPDLDTATDRLGLPKTFTVATKNAGWHLYYWQRPTAGLGNSVDKLAPGVDTRGYGGYVVAPPTPGYTILDSSVMAYLPEPIVDRLMRKPSLAERLMRKPSLAERQDRLDPVAVLKGVPEGRRNDTLFRYACRLRNQGLALEEAVILLDFAADSCEPPLEGYLSYDMAARVWETYDSGRCETCGKPRR